MSNTRSDNRTCYSLSLCAIIVTLGVVFSSSLELYAEEGLEPGASMCAAEGVTPYNPNNPPMLDPYIQSQFGNFGATIKVLVPLAATTNALVKPFAGLFYNSVLAAEAERFRMAGIGMTNEAARLWTRNTPTFIRITNAQKDYSILEYINGNRVKLTKSGNDYLFPYGYLKLAANGSNSWELKYPGGMIIKFENLESTIRVDHAGIVEQRDYFKGVESTVSSLDPNTFARNNPFIPTFVNNYAANIKNITYNDNSIRYVFSLRFDEICIYNKTLY